MRLSNWPAAPTKGSPCRSSSAPGASPTNMIRASGLPTPKTVCVRVALNSAQRTHCATRADRIRSFSSRSARGIVDCGALKSDALREQAVAAVASGAGTLFVSELVCPLFRDRDAIRVTPAARRLDSCCAVARRDRDAESPDMYDILPKISGRFRGALGRRHSVVATRQSWYGPPTSGATDPYRSRMTVSSRL